MIENLTLTTPSRHPNLYLFFNYANSLEIKFSVISQKNAMSPFYLLKAQVKRTHDGHFIN
ncbi:hypothetical protein LDI01_15290 [Lentilactobacillus diolivorans]|uniref:Uncharacterized protein n=1 Tax=Lentilactobacillus diolivorans TaxID=179838 RepID=A0ABQ0XCX8_9LACO|nr:hypothetical protein LDI01_15290 [Lentilactobacillus diolivorans]